MNYAFPIRAATKDDAKAAIAEEFDEITSTSSTADWAPAQGAADALIDALEENASLDIVATVAGDVIFIGDTIRHVKFSFSAMLTDRQ